MGALVITNDNPVQDLGKIVWDAPYHPNFLWQISPAGYWRAGSALTRDVPRAALLLRQVPNDLTFTIGKSKEADDWYFAQHQGTWTVNFTLDKTYSGNGYLTIPVAGGQGNVTLTLNGQPIGNVNHGDDGSVRRSANRSGAYARFEITFPANLLKKGENSLVLQDATPMGNSLPNGIMYDTLVMEAD